ncbi:MAG: MFS transporter [Alphaproteobacteria bacterium]|nr:MFS transporter [Alphaproteobacteria bacterium]MBV9692911.1 MFS transporter [Alphaproteobacteria bacterium]
MTSQSELSPTPAQSSIAERASSVAVLPTVYSVIFAIAFCHMLNDMMQSLLPAIYPNLKRTFDLDFAHIGLVTLTFQVTSSLLQPLVGLYTDRRAVPFALPIAMVGTFVGLLLLAFAASYSVLLIAAALVGMGSSVFHPESSRVAHMAAGPRRGFAQSMFQWGGSTGSALGALGAASIVAAEGQRSIAWFCVMAAIAIGVLSWVGIWYRHHGMARAKRAIQAQARAPLPKRVVARSLAILVILIFSKFVYLASLSSYYTFYLIERFHLSVRDAQLHLFVFLAAVAVGTIAGGPLGDRFGRKHLIWFSVLGALPFTLMLPHANLFWTSVLSACAGVTLASAFPAIVVYGQELVPAKVGTISGLFFGLSFGMGGLGAGALGWLADLKGIGFVYGVCAFLPALGLLAAFLPDLRKGA